MRQWVYPGNATGTVEEVAVVTCEANVLSQNAPNLVWRYARHVVLGQASTPTRWWRCKDVHDGKDTTLGLGSLSDSIHDFNPQVANAMIPSLDLTLTGRALQKCTVHALSLLASFPSPRERTSPWRVLVVGRACRQLETLWIMTYRDKGKRWEVEREDGDENVCGVTNHHGKRSRVFDGGE